MSQDAIRRIAQRAFAAGERIRVPPRYVGAIDPNFRLESTEVAESYRAEDVDDAIRGFMEAAQHPAIKDGLQKLLAADPATKALFVTSETFDLSVVSPLTTDCIWHEICETVCEPVCKRVCSTVCEIGEDGKEICRQVCEMVCNEVCKRICHKVCTDE